MERALAGVPQSLPPRAFLRCGIALLVGLVALPMLASASDAAAHDRCDGCARSSSAYISVDEARALRAARPETRVVDVRPAPTYAEVDMVAVVRVSPLRLRAQTAWRESPMVLLGSGAGYRALEGLRETLHSEGFADVRILDGGVPQWLRNVEGRPPDLALMLIDAARLPVLDEPERWTVLDLSVTPKGGLGRANYLAMSAERPEAVAGAAAAALGSASRSAVPNLLVIGDDEALSARVLQALARLPRTNVFALREGWNGWDAHQRLHKALAAARGNTHFDEAGGQCW